ncbi:hypothetical protein F444_11124 [Phytophthora nicotianae P1976]|uniref:Chromo domain-containing protein n=1 Tax=Phytophthora nicotianae P1976 TaxID=1317066 RepID=A0A081A1Y6_PHYNI|nr:hypothetical protein F444_11124 [Phytophthora nicotianae P1976]
MRIHPVFYVGLSIATWLSKSPFKPTRLKVEATSWRFSIRTRTRLGGSKRWNHGELVNSMWRSHRSQSEMLEMQESTNSPRSGTSLRDRPLRDERGRSRQVRMRREDADAVPASADSQLGNPAEARPPPALLDKHGEPHFHVERLVARRRRRGRTQYLVKWRGYPHSQNSWEVKVHLRENCIDVVDAYNLVQPLPMSHIGLRPHRQVPSASRQ